MKAILFLILLFNFSITISFSQSNSFSKIYNDNFSYSAAYDMVKTDDNGLIICGSGQYNLNIIKIDSLGIIQWSKQLGNQYSSLSSVIRTSDSCFVAVGSIYNYSFSDYDFLILKIDRNGNILRSKSISRVKDQGSNSIVQTLDGGYILQGFEFSYTSPTLSEIVVKFDSLLNIQWTNVYLGSNNITSGSSIKQLPDSNYIMCGLMEASIAPFDNYGYLKKIDQAGNVLWANLYLSNAAQFFRINDFVIVDNGFILYGSTDSGTIIIKTDVDGNIIWSENFETIYGTSNCINCPLPKITKLSNGNLIIPTGSPIYNWSAFLINLDTSGTVNWTRSLDNSVHVALESDGGGLYLLGNKHPMYSINKVDSFGNGITCTSSYQMNVSGNAATSLAGTFSKTSLTLTANNVYLIDSTIFIPSQDGCLDIFNSVDNIQESNFEIYPNPSSSDIAIKFSEVPESGEIMIFDMLGKVVFKNDIKDYQNQNFEIKLNLKRGVYIAIFQNMYRAYRKKIVIN